MLSDDQNDQPERTEAGTPTPEAGQPAETVAPAAPVVTRRTRKAPARKAAAAPAPLPASTGRTPHANAADQAIARARSQAQAPQPTGTDAAGDWESF